MSDWKSVVGLPVAERARIAQLVPFGAAVIEFRAKVAVIVDYDPEALAVKEKELEREQKRRDAEFEKRMAELGHNGVRPLGGPTLWPPGTKPWLDDVPTVQTVVHDFPIPPDEVEGLGEGIWIDGNDTQAYEDDSRRRRLLMGVEYRLAIPLPPTIATSPSPALETGDQGRPAKGRELYLAKLQERLSAGEVLGSLAQEAKFLSTWYRETYPRNNQPTAKTIENSIRASYNAHKNGAQNRP